MRETSRYKKRCIECGAKFVAIRQHRKYCSNFCRHRALVPLAPPKPKRPCIRCGKLFRPKLDKRQYCSDRCSYRDYTDRNRAAYNARMRELHHRQRVQTPWKRPIATARTRAKKEGLPFDLTMEWGEEIWTGYCAVSGLPFVIARKAPRTLFSPTIDKIIPKDGYLKSNSRFVLWGVNAFKQNGTDAEVLKIAQAIVTRAALLCDSACPSQGQHSRELPSGRMG